MLRSACFVNYGLLLLHFIPNCITETVDIYDKLELLQMQQFGGIEKMIFGTPYSWLLNEVIASLLLLICIAHIVKRDHAFLRFSELVAYMLGAGIFENIVVWTDTYKYSTARIMMFGKVPFAVLFLEGVIFYAALLLVEKLRLPKWTWPFGVGVLSSIQDMTLDPASVYDLHSINGVMEGQWNWTHHYSGGFVDIPFFNFSGWLTMMFFFTIGILVGRRVASRKPRFAVAYPWVAMIFLLLMLISVNQFLLYGMPFFPRNQKWPELVMLVLNYAISLGIFGFYALKSHQVDWHGDGFAIWLPLLVHVYALISILLLGIGKAIVPVCIVIILHCALLLWLWRSSQQKTPLAEVR